MVSIKYFLVRWAYYDIYGKCDELFILRVAAADNEGVDVMLCSLRYF